MRRVVPWMIALAVVAAGVSACDKNTEPVPVPTPIAPPTTTEKFAGTLSPAGTNLHFFQVQAPSEVHVTVTQLTAVAVDADPSADPPVAAAPATPLSTQLTIAVGQQAITTIGVQCAPLKSVVAAPGPTPQLTGQALAGTYCVSITDTNTQLPRAATYAISVAHS
jgi:hypothetical protein